MNNNDNNNDDGNDNRRKDSIIWVHSKMDNEKDEGNNSSHHHSRYIFHSTTLEGTTNSSSTTEGLPYVGCYKGFNDGALFPLREGLLFFKPPLFVHRSKLVSISCGRGSGLGGGSSRYVDMIATLDDDDSDDDDDDVETNKSATKTKKKKKKKKKKETILEFTNINHDELPGLNDYIHKVLIPAMKSDCDNVVDDVTGDNDKNTDIDANSDEDDVYIDDDEDVAVATLVVGDDNDEGEQSEAQCATKKSITIRKYGCISSSFISLSYGIAKTFSGHGDECQPPRRHAWSIALPCWWRRRRMMMTMIRMSLVRWTTVMMMIIVQMMMMTTTLNHIAMASSLTMVTNNC